MLAKMSFSGSKATNQSKVVSLALYRPSQYSALPYSGIVPSKKQNEQRPDGPREKRLPEQSCAGCGQARRRFTSERNKKEENNNDVNNEGNLLICKPFDR